MRPAWMRYFPRIEVEEMVDANEAVEFGDGPTEFVKCPYCRKEKGVTFVEHEASAVTYCASFLIFLSCGWFSFCLLPVCWPVLRTVVHHCPECNNVEIFTVQIGGCAVVLSKKYAVLAGLLVLVLFFLYWRRDSHGHLLLDEPLGGVDLTGPDSSWDSYLHYCGFRKSAANPLRARKKFEEIYVGNRVVWEGSVQKIMEGFSILVWDAPGMIKLQMTPTEGSREGDISLLFNPDLTERVAELDEGQAVRFNATILGMGSRGAPHVLQLWHILPPVGAGGGEKGKLPGGTAPEEPPPNRASTTGEHADAAEKKPMVEKVKEKTAPDYRKKDPIVEMPSGAGNDAATHNSKSQEINGNAAGPSGAATNVAASAPTTSTETPKDEN